MEVLLALLASLVLACAPPLAQPGAVAIERSRPSFSAEDDRFL